MAILHQSRKMKSQSTRRREAFAWHWTGDGMPAAGKRRTTGCRDSKPRRCQRGQELWTWHLDGEALKTRSAGSCSPRPCWWRLSALCSSSAAMRTGRRPSRPRPTGLTAPSVSHDSVTLTWDDPGDSSITGYQVLRRSRDGDEYGDGRGAAEFVSIVDDTGSSATTYADTSVTARTRYVYRVKARNSAGNELAVPLSQRRDDRRANRPDRADDRSRQHHAQLGRPRRQIHNRIPGAQALPRR